jgi:hypothetical protein
MSMVLGNGDPGVNSLSTFSRIRPNQTVSSATTLGLL